jgi:hypothetical protein
MLNSPSEEIRCAGGLLIMARNFKRSRGTRENTAVDAGPAPTASGPAAGGITPLGAVTTTETVKDVPQVSQMASYPTDFGYIFHDLKYEDPNVNQVQFYARILRYSLTGYFGATPAGIGFERIDDFYTTLYDKLLSKAVIRDGYRHLPDTLATNITTEALFGLWVGEVVNVRAVRALIDSISWNDATITLRGELSRKYRRAVEVWNDLSTFQIPMVYTMHAMLHPVVSDQPGGAVIFSLVNNSVYFNALGSQGTPGCYVDWTRADDIVLNSSNIDDILCEAEAAVQILRNETFVKALTGANAGFTYTTGYQADIKYFFTLMHELVYPSGLPEPGQIVVDPGEFQQILYGDAIYGYYAKKTVGVVDNRYPVGYPFVTGANMGLVYRRGFNQLSPVVFGGFKQPWAVKDMYGSDHTPSVLGLFAQCAKMDGSDQMYDCNAYRCWSKDVHNYYDPTPVTGGWKTSTGWYSVQEDVNFDDATELRSWMEDGSPASDHQWNEQLFSKLDPSNFHGPAGMKAYGFHMPVDVPAELLRASLCSAWNLPYIR